ncbi:MAG: PstS family phosphate ABC transporter substrate-binding protein [Oleiphilus sp.]
MSSLKSSVLFAINCLILSTLSISAYSSGQDKPETQGQLFLGGTGAAIGALKIFGKLFEESHPNVSITVYPSLGSGGGIRALQANKLSVAFTSRPLKEDEQKQGLLATEIIRTPFVFVTHPDINVDSLSLDEIALLLSGQTKQWADGTLVRPVLRPLYDADSKIVMNISPSLAESLKIAHQRSGKNIAATDYDSANELERINGSIGTTTMLLIRAENRRLNILALDKVAPNLENFTSGRYPYGKSIYAVTPETTKPLAKQFIKFLKAQETQQQILKLASLPVQ